MKIEKILLIILTIGSINLSFGQVEIKITQSQNKRLIEVLNDCVQLAETQTNNLNIRIYQTDNKPGSAGFDNGEITYNLLIAVSEFDEYPNQSLFEIGPFLNPTFLEWSVEAKSCIIEYGVLDKRETVEIEIKLSELKIIET